MPGQLRRTRRWRSGCRRVRPDELRNPLDLVDSNPSEWRTRPARGHETTPRGGEGLTADQRQALDRDLPRAHRQCRGHPAEGPRRCEPSVCWSSFGIARDRVFGQDRSTSSARAVKIASSCRRVNRLDMALRKAAADAETGGRGRSAAAGV